MSEENNSIFIDSINVLNNRAGYFIFFYEL